MSSIVPRVGLLAVLVAVPTTGVAQTCGIASLFDLSELAGRDLSKEQWRELVAEYLADESSLLDIKQAAERLGLPLVGVAANFDGLTMDLPGPKIIHLSDPAHFLVVARASGAWVQLLDGGSVVVTCPPQTGPGVMLVCEASGPTREAA